MTTLDSNDDHHERIIPDLAPAPLGVIAYSSETTRPLLRVVRAVGTLAVVIGVVQIPVMAVEVLGPTAGLYYRPYFMLARLVGTVVSLALTGLLIFGGSECLRRHPRGRRILLAWAYGAFVYAAYAVVVNLAYDSLYLGPSSMRGLSTTRLAMFIGRDVVQSLRGIGFPLVVAVLFSGAEFRRTFDEPAGASN